jgi:hypothetical protein
VIVRGVNTLGHGPQSIVVPGTPQTTPYAPTLTATAADSQVTLVYGAPSDDGGLSIDGYEYTLDGGSSWVAAGASPLTVTGLTPGTEVQVAVRAHNALGAGTASGVQPVTPFTRPSAPSVFATTTGNQRVVVTLAAPASDGFAPITRYEYSLDGGTTWVARPDAATTFTVSGLVNTVSYPLAFRAVNLAGAGPASATRTVVPNLVPVLVVGSTPTPPDELSPGSTRSTVDSGTASSPTVTTSGPTMTVDDGTVRLQIAAQNSDGSSRELSAGGYLRLVSQGRVSVSGSGLVPGSQADVWAFSTPTLLGVVTVGADGTFAATFDLPAGLAVGQHTLQVNGIRADGASYSAATGVVVEAAPVAAVSTPAATGALASTGAGSSDLGLLSLLSVLLGAALVVIARRRARA